VKVAISSIVLSFIISCLIFPFLYICYWDITDDSVLFLAGLDHCLRIKYIFSYIPRYTRNSQLWSYGYKAKL
jgi:hypothetical protein